MRPEGVVKGEYVEHDHYAYNFVPVGDFEVDSQDYVIEGGNLYFYISLEDFILGKYSFGISSINEFLISEFLRFLKVSSYRVNIQIETVVPLEIEDLETERNELDIFIPPNIQQYYEAMNHFYSQYSTEEEIIIDTTSNDLAKTALAQATSYLISDYFNVHTLALEMSQSQVEEEYITHITQVSTLYTSIILAPLTILSAGATAAITNAQLGVVNTMLLTTAIYIASIPIQVITETWEELYLDPWIESEMIKLGEKFDVSREASEFWAMFFTSFREAFMGAGSALIGGLTGAGSDSQISNINDFKVDIDILVDNIVDSDVNAITEGSSTDFALEEFLNEGYMGEQLSAEITQAEAGISQLTKAKKRSARKIFKDLVISKRMADIMFSIPSFFVGGGGMATMALFLDLSTDILFEIELGRLVNNWKVIDPLIDSLGKHHDLLVDLSFDLQVRQANIKPVEFMPEIKGLVQLQSKSRILTNLGITTSNNEYIKNRQKFEKVEENHNKIKVLPSVKIDLSDSNEAFVGFPEERLAAAIEGDPVWIDEHGVKHWGLPAYVQYNPLSGEPYVRWVDQNNNFLKAVEGNLDLDGFIAMLDRRIPVFQEQDILPGLFVYTIDEDGIPGVTQLRGDMPLSQVFDMIGYQRDTASLRNQFFGNDDNFFTLKKDPNAKFGYNELLKTEKIDTFVSDYGLLFGARITLLGNMLQSESISDIEDFIEKLNNIVDELQYEIFGLTDYTLLDGQDYRLQITIDMMKNSFLDKWLIKNPVSPKEITWNNEVNKHWKQTYENVIDRSNNAKYEVFNHIFKLSVITTLFAIAQTNEIEDFNEIFSLLNQALDGNSLYSVFSKSFLMETYIKASFGVFQITLNQLLQEIVNPYSSFGMWKGFLVEADLELNYLPEILKGRYFDDSIKSLSMEIAKFHYSWGRNKISTGEHINVKSNTRFPDLSIWKFELEEKEDFDIEYDITASKYSLSGYAMEHALIDTVSSLYLLVRENINSEARFTGISSQAKLYAKASIVFNPSFETPMYNNFDIYYKDLLKGLENLDFFNLKINKQWKIDQVLVAEEGFIIEEVNQFIWKRYSYSLTSDQFIDELRSLSRNQQFISQIYKSIANKFTKGGERSWIFSIQNYLSSLVMDVSSTATISHKGNIVEIPGVIHSSGMSYYKITDKIAKGKYNILQRIFHLNGWGGYLETGPLTENTKLNKGFKVIFSIDSHGNPVHGLAEISQYSLADLPIGWHDGYVYKNRAGEYEIVKGLIFSDHFGHLLSSQHFNPNTGTFTHRDINMINNEIRIDFLGTKSGLDDNRFGIQILFDFSKSEDIGQINSLITVDFINPAFDKNVKYRIPIGVADYFSNLDISRLTKIARESKSVTNIEGISYYPISPTTIRYISKSELFRLYNHFTQSYSIYPSMYIASKIGLANMRYYPGTGYIVPGSGRTSKDNEGVANKLFKTESELRKFLLIDNNGNQLSESVFSRKEWLAFQVEKIISFPDSELQAGERFSELIKEARGRLRELSPGLDEFGKFINPLDTNLVTGDRKYFSEVGMISELEKGKSIFEILNYGIWGHVSFMSILLNSISYYKSLNGFKLVYHSLENMKTSTAARNQKITLSTKRDPEGDMHANEVFTDAWALLFGNSHTFLPVRGINSFKNKVEFGYTPTPFSEVFVTESNFVDANRFLQDIFLLGYNKDNYEDNFILSGREIYKAMDAKIYQTIKDQFLTKSDYKDGEPISKIETIYDIISINIKQGLLYSGIQWSKINTRVQVENLLIDYKFSDSSSTLLINPETFQRDIVFQFVYDPSNIPLRILYNKDDFIGENTEIFRDTYSSQRSVEELKSNLFNEVLKNRFDEVKKIVMANNEKARFYISLNLGHEYGYQYISRSRARNDGIPIPLPASKIGEPIYLDVDLTSGMLEQELAKLKFIVGLSMMIPKYYPSGSSDVHKTNIMLIMKPAGASASDPSICYFTHNDIGELTSVFSMSGAPSEHLFNNLQISGSLSSTGVFASTHAKIWSKNQFFFPIGTKSEFMRFFGSGNEVFNL